MAGGYQFDRTGSSAAEADVGRRGACDRTRSGGSGLQHDVGYGSDGNCGNRPEDLAGKLELSDRATHLRIVGVVGAAGLRVGVGLT